jgi:hypothetical protein
MGKTGKRLLKETSMTTLFRRLSVALLFLAGLGGWSAFAQFLSGIEGIVHETSGAVLPGPP